MNSVWLVFRTTGDYYDSPELEDIFSTEEKAAAYVKAMQEKYPKHGWTVEDWPVD